MFGADDADEDFLAPTGGAKLASLFGVDQHSNQTNESFQYTAPKQPRKNSTSAPVAQKSTPPPGAPAVLFGAAVQAFRYINGQYVKQGKLGLAVLGNHTTKEFTLLLYLSQQKQVTAAKIHPGFVLTVQPNSYCTFYDDNRHNWSMMFDCEKALCDFCKEICLAKANSAASLESTVTQDLSLGDGQAVKNGDTVELLYTGWLLQNHTTGEVFDSNCNTGKSMRLKLGAGKAVKGLEEGILGMKKSGRRLLIIPPSLAYGSKGVANHALANSTLIFEAELCRVKFYKDSEPDRSNSVASTAPSAAPAAPSPAPSVSSLSSEPSIQQVPLGPELAGQPQHCENPNLLGEQQTFSPQNSDATKAKLISRMAKMGQPMFPFIKEAASHPESSDSDVEDMSNNHRVKNQLTTPSPVHISTAAPASAHSVPAVVSASPNVPSQPTMFGGTHAFQAYPYTQLLASSQLHPAGPIHPVQTIPYMGDVTSFLMTETRQHNTEIRQSIGKVAEKVDQLTSKMDILERQGSLFMASSSVSMETSVLMHNIQRIVKENECLKKEMLEKNSCIEKQNSKITELITQNQRHMEQSDLILENRNNFLKSSNEQCQARLLEAEQEKSRLVEDLVSSKAQLSQLRLEASTQRQEAAELQTKLTSLMESSESQRQNVDDLEAQLKEAVGAAETLKAQHLLDKQRCEAMEAKVHKVEEQLKKLQSDKDRLEQVALKEEVRRGEQQHGFELAKTAEERDALQDELTQLQDKYTVSEQHWMTAKKKLERKMAELQNKMAEQQETSGDTTAKVKQVMNGVFHTLRGEFDVSESYSGQAVMEVILLTIKNVTLQLLTGSERSSPSGGGEVKDGSDQVKRSEEVSCADGTTENMREKKQGGVSEPPPETAEEEIVRATESSVNVEETAAPGLEHQQLGDKSAAAAAAAAASAAAAAVTISPQENSLDSENPDESELEQTVHDDPGGEDGDGGEVDVTSSSSFTPPANPPPDPPPVSVSLEASESSTRLAADASHNSKAVSPSPTNDPEDDDMSLKGRPPSVSLFADDDDNDGDWLD